ESNVANTSNARSFRKRSLGSKLMALELVLSVCKTKPISALRAAFSTRADARCYPRQSFQRSAGLDCLCQRAVDDEIGAGDATCHRACKEHHAGSDFLRRTHASGRIERHRRLVEIGHAAFDILPDATLEIRVARRHSIDADALGNELVAEALGVVDQGRLEGAIRTGGEVDLEARH